ncbi:hexose carrier protein HEX6-like isoform X1 [Gossypium australe]|uniref:Hexose carrier protein HEX6-like isoform X1 n=1 Tax=Gossypium australe TaxID=47621 RepID=A0A5B6UJ46_9ROSI|nr:hexose carrier protein HEX6-like isoform X1 [Gossypium australe]
MAFAEGIPGERGQYNGKVTLLVVLSCVVAASGGLIFGYDLGVSGGVTSMDPFLKKFFPNVYRRMKEGTKISNYCKFDSQLLTLFTSSLYLSGLVSSLFASTVTRVFGRKASMLVAGVAVLIGSALGGAASNLYMLSIPLYISEMALPKHRGAMNIIFDTGVGIGVLIANIINFCTEKIDGGWGWRISLSMAAVPASILTIGAIILPDTPNSLIQKDNNLENAKRVLQRIRGTNDVQQELDDLLKASSISKTTKDPFKKILQRKYRPQLVMAAAIPFFAQMTGINVITFYAPILFRTIGLRESSSLLSAVVIRCFNVGCTFISMFVVDKQGDHGGLSKASAYVVLVLICIYISGFGLSWGPLGWLVPSEIYPLEIRSAGQSITVAVSFFFCFLIGQTFLAMLCHMKAGIFFFFGGWVALMTLFIYFFLPETKNVPIEKVEQLWKEHWFWKRFVGDEVDDNIYKLDK